ncbi:hypothetical protein C8Q75DRAFT_781215 [Abortiporus biennis]|nr:hypothetical protein C8Q75DRAFT_781215 [Abortiporus biennis]
MDRYARTSEETHSAYQEKLDLNREIVSGVYRQVFDEFYNWEANACQNDINSLAAINPLYADYPDPGHFDTVDETQDVDMADEDDELELDLLDFDLGFMEDIVLKDIPVEYFSPHPKYEACTPSDRNIRSTKNREILEFIKYIGEPNFRLKYFVDLFDAFEWQVQWRDPDMNVIASTVITRLSSPSKEYDVIHPELAYLSHSDIDETRILHQRVGEIAQQMQQRDPLIWAGVAFGSGNNSIPIPDLSTRLLDRVNAMSRKFCHLPDCMTAHCSMHQQGWKPANSPAPTTLNSSLSSQRASPCSNECYTRLRSDGEDVLVRIEEESGPDEVKDLILMFPDAIPCDLALLTRRSCSQIFALRKQLIPDTVINGLKAQRMTSDSSDFQFIDTDLGASWTSFSWVPCQHQGACYKNPKCRCFRYKIHCRSSCLCSEECSLQVAGCKCSALDCKDKSASEYACACARLLWECTFNLCTYPKALTTNSRRRKEFQTQRMHNCNNMNLQINDIPELEVKTGLFGLGVFAAEFLKAGQYLGEYVAEAFPVDYNPPKDLCAKHIGLNYAFELDKMYGLDAVSVGNETRYINHTEEENQNVIAKTVLVNGIHRIGFWTCKKVEVGEELFWCYGETFWGIGDHVEEVEEVDVY